MRAVILCHGQKVVNQPREVLQGGAGFGAEGIAGIQLVLRQCGHLQHHPAGAEQEAAGPEDEAHPVHWRRDGGDFKPWVPFATAEWGVPKSDAARVAAGGGLSGGKAVIGRSWGADGRQREKAHLRSGGGSMVMCQLSCGTAVSSTHLN
jgi:hypothetical protein